MELITLTDKNFDEYSYDKLPLLAVFYAAQCLRDPRDPRVLRARRRGATRCDSCQEVKHILEKLLERENGVIMGACDINAHYDFTDICNCTVIPTLILFREGKELGRMVEPKTEKEITRFLDEHLGNFELTKQNDEDKQA